jgi:thiol peroxidase
MAIVTFKGNPVHTRGSLPVIGEKAPGWALVKTDLSTVLLSDFKGYRVVLNIFPSVDTGVCAASVRHFNEKANELVNTKVLCISKDLPFALARFCGAEGLENVIPLSDFRNEFGNAYNVVFTDGPLQGLLSRVVMVLDENGKVIYTEQVSEITEEPDYNKALSALL